MMSVLAQRLSKLLEEDMELGESDVNVPAEEQHRGDRKKTEDLVKEDKQQAAKMAGDANGQGFSKKEVGLSQAIEPQGYKEMPSHHRIFNLDNVDSPAPRENIYENNEDMSNGMIFIVNPEAHEDTFEHQMYKLGFVDEETSPHQKNKAPTGNEDFFFDKTDGKLEDNFDQSTNKSRNAQQGDNGTLEKDTDFEGNKKELGETSFLPDFLAFLRKLLLGKEGENMADSENTHVNDLPSVKPKAKDIGSSKAKTENPRTKRSSGDRIYFPGEVRQHEDEFGQDEGEEPSSPEEFIEPGSRPRHDFDPDAGIFELEAEVVENGVGEGEGPRPPPPDLSNDLNVNFPPRDSEFALEINPDAEIIDPELVAAEERLFRSGRRDK